MSNGIKLFDAGFQDLVSVVPPNAQISPHSTLQEKNLGKSPGVLGSYGWKGYNFTGAETPTRETVAQYDEWGANIGIMARHFPAVDVDVRDPEIRKVAIKLADEILGKAPIRLSTEPRALLMFRCEEPFARMALVITRDGVSHLIEALAGERQYLVAGQHPSGKRYRWHPKRPLSTPDALPLVTREGMLGYLRELGERLKAAGFETEVLGTGEQREAHAPPQEDLAAPSIEALAELVRELPNDERIAQTWEDWIKVGHAIKAAAAGDPIGEELFLDWTDRCTRVDPADEAEASSQYGRMRGPHRVGWSYLVELAEIAGIVNTAQDDFAGMVDLDAAPETKSVSAQLPEPNDEAVVQWLLPELKDRVRYEPASRRWFVWAGHRWQHDAVMDGEQVIRGLLRRLCGLWRALGESAPGKEGAPALRASESYSNAPKINGVLRLLQAPLACAPADFDVDPWLLNTPGGVYDLRTGDVTPCEPAGMHSRATAVAPRRGRAPLWRRFLDDTTEGDTELQRYLQMTLGYMLTGQMDEKALWYVWGAESDTGKSTLVRTVTALWGSYADSVSPEVFMRSRNDRIPAELARMPGVRLVTATEPEHGRSWDEQKVKSITGGDTIEVRFLHGQPFTYRPQFKILIVGNSEPEIRHLDSAMLRRIHIVPCNVPVARERQIANLSERMVQEEGEAILAWLIEGCVAWQREGLTLPAIVAAKTEEYVEDEDAIGAWAKEECEFGDEHEATRQELYVAWSSWARARGEEPGKAKAFKRQFYPVVKKYKLRDRLIGDRRLGGYRGIRLRSAVEDGTEFETA